MSKIFQVYDSKAEAYLIPFFAPNAGLAIRMIVQATLNPDHNFSTHAEDFTLFECGEWDEITGIGKWYEIRKGLGVLVEHQAKRRGDEMKEAFEKGWKENAMRVAKIVHEMKPISKPCLMNQLQEMPDRSLIGGEEMKTNG